ncbi:MAG: long-chain fatty acid--CoA ligase [Deltaproteobacteria bacterium]|nr:long-chain fatty acid--CoA ligase [Deltaproteobacteria bacterium]
MNLANNLEKSAYFFPERPAVCENGRTATYQQLNEQANRIATSLIKMGVGQGDLIGLLAPNSMDWMSIYFGVMKTGAVAITFSSLLKGDELSLLVRHSQPRIVFTYNEKLDDLFRLKDPCGIEKIISPHGDLDLGWVLQNGSPHFKAIERDRGDTAAILYTGGTTGTPKGAMLTHEGINFSSFSIAHFERNTEDDRALCFMPFNHVFGQIHIMNATIMTGGCLEILPSFDLGKTLELMAAGRITKFFAVPTIYVRLLGVNDLSEKLGKLRYCFSAAASLPREIVKQWKERTGIKICESYGMTEGMPVTYNHYYPDRHVVGSVGQVIHGVEVQIRDTAGNLLEQGHEGEICFRGQVVMKGYLNNPESNLSAFWENGWLRSGDIGLFDSDGYLYIVDRLKDMIITGGENVYPREIEEVLYVRPEVQECAVVGFPDKEWGERVAVFIIPKPGQNINPEELKAFLKSRLSPFKVPKDYIIVSEMPKSPAGKILKRELRKQFLGQKP